MRLFDDKTSNGSSSNVNWGGGEGQVSVWGEFDGATATLEWSPDRGETWIPVGAASNRPIADDAQRCRFVHVYIRAGLRDDGSCIKSARGLCSIVVG